MAKDDGAEGRRDLLVLRRASSGRLYDAITVPNSICFSADGATAYFTGKSPMSSTASTAMPRRACRPASRSFHRHRSEEGGLDGSVVDADGVLWNARWGGGRVDAYAPDGKLLRTIPVPARQSSCPAFVGAMHRDRRYFGLERHGSSGARHRSGGRQDIPARHCCQRPVRAARSALTKLRSMRCHNAA